MRFSDLSDKGKKGFVLFLIIGVIIIIFASHTDNYVEIIDAAVDPGNGDIAFAYSDAVNGNYFVSSFDSNGTILFSKSYHSGHGTVYLQYDQEKLFVYVSGGSVLFVYDRDGNEIDESTDTGWIKELTEEQWDGWEKKSGSLCSTVGENEYIYCKNSFWKAITGSGGCKLSVRRGSGEEIPIYRSGKID